MVTSISARLQRGILLSTFLVFILNPVAHTLPADDQGLARSMAKALADAKVKTVVVFDFMGPGDRLSQLGRELADGFSRMLTTSGAKFDVIDRVKVQAVIEKNRVAPDVIRDPEISWWLARQLNADALIVGKLSPIDGNKLEIGVAAAKTKDGKNLASLSVTAPTTDEMKARLSKSLSEDHTKERLAPDSPKEYFPKCIYCPSPQFPGTGMTYKEGDTVELVVRVDEDGLARDIEYIKATPNETILMAIEAIQTWRFQPGQGPDGKPRAVWQPIQITIHFMH
jgi:hypothetical protein